MILYIFSLLIFVACNSSAMLSTGFAALIFPKKNTSAKKIDPLAASCESKWRPKLKYVVSPNSIEFIETEIVSLPEGKAIGYDALLYTGDQVTCFLILEGVYAGEKWAL